MNTYLFPIQAALITFPIVSFFLTLPFLIVQYRKYGYVNKVRSLVLYSMLLYFISAYYLVILPLPANLDNCVPGGSGVFSQWTPFTFIRDIMKETNVVWSQPSTYVTILGERAFWQAGFNVALTLPLGVYLRYYFRRSFLATTVIAFVVSLFFETTQRTGLYGIYACPYRLFDVDDLMLNTFGGALGFLLAPLITYFLPHISQLDANVDLMRRPVGFMRRIIALWLDYLCIGFIYWIIAIFIVADNGNDVDHFLNDLQSNGWVLAITIFVYFMLMPLWTEGKTFGKWVTRIHLIDDRLAADSERTNKLSFKGLLIRYGLLYFGIGGINYIFFYVLNSGYILELGGFTPIVIILWLVFNVFVGLHVLLHLFRRDKRLFYEKMSGTRNVITIPDRMLPYSGTVDLMETKEDAEENPPVRRTMDFQDGSQLIIRTDAMAEPQEELSADEIPEPPDVASVRPEAVAKQEEKAAEGEAMDTEERVEWELTRLRAKLNQDRSDK
ncbi:VanZ family protein [Paenibacillus popilliae]|uniref:Glycopeptide antibiotics resistance protein n=1 Tax=Paenibacillus popilliae ATCC 14706 TaxID=1212764 RepID=M9LCD1_PAEPP|nr:VanZ family protein [Paenibacillus popilliae]GAC43707.1 glycopeptide antibiotics resistance protein [Paenibacillus popilliae ATCC 14706]